MSETHELRGCRDTTPEQLAALYSAGKLVYGNYPLFDLYTSRQAHERLARYLPGWMQRDDIQWSYMGYSFDSDLFVVGFSGTSQECIDADMSMGADVDGYYLFKIDKDELLFQGLGLARGAGVYGKLLKGLKAMYSDLIDLQLD